MYEQMLVDFFKSSWDFLLGLIGGSGLIVFFCREYISLRLKRGHIIWEEKRSLAQEVLKIVSEGNTKNYKEPPTDSNHINFVATGLEAYHPKMAKELFRYAFLWFQNNVVLNERKKASPNLNWQKDEELFIESQHEISKVADYLIKEAHKLKK